jgi:hypothetical protein
MPLPAGKIKRGELHGEGQGGGKVPGEREREEKDS